MLEAGGGDRAGHGYRLALTLRFESGWLVPVWCVLVLLTIPSPAVSVPVAQCLSSDISRTSVRNIASIANKACIAVVWVYAQRVMSSKINIEIRTVLASLPDSVTVRLSEDNKKLLAQNIVEYNARNPTLELATTAHVAGLLRFALEHLHLRSKSE